MSEEKHTNTFTHGLNPERAHQRAEIRFWNKQIIIAKWLNFLTAIAATSTLAGLYFLYGGLVESTNARISANRAWLYPENFSFGSLLNSSELHVTMDTKNIGHEPATHVLFSNQTMQPPMVGLLPYTGIDPHLIHIPSDSVCSRQGPNDYAGSTIFPDEQWSYERHLPLLPGQLESILKGSNIIFIKDCATYTTFGQQHKSSFCFYLIHNPIDGEMHTYHCPENNDAD